MSIILHDLAITSLETISAYTTSGAYAFTLDELQDASIANTEDTQDITGKGGRLIAQIKRNKGVTISGTNGLLSGGLLEAQTGSDFVNGETDAMWIDYVTVSGNEAATAYKAVGTAGAEIVALHTKQEDGTLGTEYVQAASAAAGKFAYDPATKKLTFAADEIADGTEIVVRYKRHIVADHLSNMGDVYSKTLQLYVDALAEDRCSNVYHVQFYIPRASFSGEFSIDMGDNQTVHAFEANSLASTCLGKEMLWTYTIFGQGTEDAA